MLDSGVDLRQGCSTLGWKTTDDPCHVRSSSVGECVRASDMCCDSAQETAHLWCDRNTVRVPTAEVRAVLNTGEVHHNVNETGVLRSAVHPLRESCLNRSTEAVILGDVICALGALLGRWRRKAFRLPSQLAPSGDLGAMNGGMTYLLHILMEIIPVPSDARFIFLEEFRPRVVLPLRPASPYPQVDRRATTKSLTPVMSTCQQALTIGKYAKNVLLAHG